jgi:hypothetical protein
MAQNRPGGQLQSTPDHPVHVIPGAAHCGDQLTRNRNANAGVQKVFDAEVANIKQWAEEFYQQKGKKQY